MLFLLCFFFRIALNLPTFVLKAVKEHIVRKPNSFSKAAMGLNPTWNYITYCKMLECAKCHV